MGIKIAFFIKDALFKLIALNKSIRNLIFIFKKPV